MLQKLNKTFEEKFWKYAGVVLGHFFHVTLHDNPIFIFSYIFIEFKISLHNKVERFKVSPSWLLGMQGARLNISLLTTNLVFVRDFKLG